MCLQKLSDGISTLERELHVHVATNHHDLIVQATSMEKLESVLLVVTSRVEALQKVEVLLNSYLISHPSAIHHRSYHIPTPDHRLLIA